MRRVFGKNFPILNPGAAGNPRTNLMIAKKNLYLNADRTKVVAEDSEDAAFLLAGKGTEIPKETVEKYGLAEEKSRTPGENKTRTPTSNK